MTDIYAGIDAGSRAIKIALIEANGQALVTTGSTDQGVNQERLAGELLDRLLADQGLVRAHLKRTVATGYGRNLVSFADTTVTEITCHARGVRHVMPEAATIVEIGGQDSKIIRLSAAGAVRDFAMNDRCAAGTGRFLEIVADRLGTDLAGLGALAASSRAPATISSMCVVFAETEIIGLLASGTPASDIVAGVQTAILTRVMAMLGRRAQGPIVFTGGVARVPGMAGLLARQLDQPVEVAPEPQMTGALGAALIAAGTSGAL